MKSTLAMLVALAMALSAIVIPVQAAVTPPNTLIDASGNANWQHSPNRPPTSVNYIAISWRVVGYGAGTPVTDGPGNSIHQSAYYRWTGFVPAAGHNNQSATLRIPQPTSFWNISTGWVLSHVEVRGFSPRTFTAAQVASGANYVSSMWRGSNPVVYYFMYTGHAGGGGSGGGERILTVNTWVRHGTQGSGGQHVINEYVRVGTNQTTMAAGTGTIWGDINKSALAGLTQGVHYQRDFHDPTSISRFNINPVQNFDRHIQVGRFPNASDPERVNFALGFGGTPSMTQNLTVNVYYTIFANLPGPTPETFQITYKPGEGGIGTPHTAPGKYLAGAQHTIIANPSFTHQNNKDFAGWSYTIDGDVSYKPGETFNMPNGHITLYAVWVQPPPQPSP